jgi:programmed cell death 6-interacting protein
MEEVIAVPLKEPCDTGIVKPLNKLFSTSCGKAGKTKNYREVIREFNKLRNDAIFSFHEKCESSLKTAYIYYDQLCALEEKVPSCEVRIPFKWKCAFNKRSIFGGCISQTVRSIAYEKVCVLFNIAALQSSVAAIQSTESEDGLKLAAKMFQQAAGGFSDLEKNVKIAMHGPTPDLNPETLEALSALMLAQGQEILVQKAIHDKAMDAVIAEFGSQCDALYSEALKLFQNKLLMPLWDKKWIPTLAAKQAAYHGLSQYYQSLVCRANESVGEEIVRLEQALEMFRAAQQMSRKRSFFHDYVNKAQRNQTEAKRDNEFIYHEIIPNKESLPAIGKALLAKTLRVPKKLSQNFKDLFAEMVPVDVRPAEPAYNVRKNEIVNSEVMEPREVSRSFKVVWHR